MQCELEVWWSGRCGGVQGGEEFNFSIDLASDGRLGLKDIFFLAKVLNITNI